MRAWVIIPARGGSKSIPRKNLAPLGGKFLIDYPLAAAHAWGKAERVIVNTEDGGIADYVKRPGVMVYDRPKDLARDDTPVYGVIEEMLERAVNPPDVVVLLQATSPFVTPEHIESLVLLLESEKAASAQTVIACPHNSHEYNQRKRLQGNYVDFVHAEKRKEFYHSQSKPPRILFGNAVAFRPGPALSERTVFPTPSVMKVIEPPYGHDVDVEIDLKVARLLLSGGLVELEHME